MIVQLILILAVVNLALFIVLRLIFRQQLDTALIRLQRLHQENLNQQDRLKQEYETAKDDHQKEIDKGKQKAAEIQGIARENTNRLKEELILRARNEAASIIAAGKRQAQQYQEEAKDELDRKAIETSLELIKSTFSSQTMQTLHEQFINEIIELMNNLDDSYFKIETGKARVVSAFAIKDELRTVLKDFLNKKSGCQINLEFKQDEDIVAGIIVYLDESILDASLKNRLRRALENM